MTTAGSEVFLSVSSNGIKNLPASTVNSLPTSFITSASTSQLSALQNSPYYSSFSDAIKSSIASATGTTYTSTGSSSTSDSDKLKYSLTSMVLTCLVAKLLIKIN